MKRARLFYPGAVIFLALLALWALWPIYQESRARQGILELEKARQEYIQSHDYKRALKLFQSLTPRFPLRLDLKIEQAYIAAEAGETEASLDALKQAEALKPAGAQYHEIAMLYQRLGQNDRTLAILNEILKQEPKNAVWLKDRGICRFLMGKARGAVEDLEAAIRIRPGLISAYLSLGAIHDKEGRHPQAIKIYKLALLQEPEPDEKIFLDQIRRLLSRK